MPGKRQSHESLVCRDRGCASATRLAELGEDMFDVCRDSSHACDQPARDFLVAETPGYERQDIELARRKTVREP
jgi:hypothetical protein